MNSEYLDDIQLSHQKLTELLNNALDSTTRDKIVIEYIKSCKNVMISDFPKGLEWFNVSEPLSLATHLKGKVVILDFFTYCCINCMHILPDLKIIENEFSIEDGLVVVGVHSAKFENEKLSSNILSAVQRYNISHPVINDCEATMWNSCGINCWPSLLILGPQGNPLILLMGEGHRENLRFYIRNALNYYKSINQISSHALPVRSSFHLLPEMKGPLLFPGKVTSYIDTDNNNFVKLAISDTGNHRILVTLPDGTLLQNVGGKLGFKDGSFEEAQFNAPQGLVFQNESTLFVCDTENHAIRKIDLKLRTVTTVAGTGHQGIDRVGGKIGTEQEISSPWDICIYRTPDMDMSFHHPDEKIIEKEVLLIAMAGTHQIWAFFLDNTIWWKFKRFSKGTCICVAGSGREENRNNSYPQSAGFAQPSGLAICKSHKELYVADSESSTIRRVSLSDGKVSAIVGGEKSPLDLFGFGDKDGKLCEAKLQHPLAVAISNYPHLYVADTYNHKLKRVDLTSNSITTLRWVGIDYKDDFIFNEPGGLCMTEDQRTLYIADTNNHCIKIVQLSEDLHIEDIAKFTLKTNKSPMPIHFEKKKYNILTGKNLVLSTNGGKIILGLKLVYNDVTKFTEEAPHKWSIICPNDLWSSVPQSGTDINLIDTVINAQSSKEVSTFYIVYDFVICKEEKCIPKNLAVEFAVQFVENGPTEITENISVYTGITDGILN